MHVSFNRYDFINRITWDGVIKSFRSVNWRAPLKFEAIFAPAGVDATYQLRYSISRYCKYGAFVYRNGPKYRTGLCH